MIRRINIVDEPALNLEEMLVCQSRYYMQCIVVNDSYLTGSYDDLPLQRRASFPSAIPDSDGFNGCGFSSH